MRSRNDNAAPKRATIEINRGLPPVRISSERIVSGAGWRPDTLSHRTAHWFLSRGRSVRTRKRSYRARSGLSISSKRLVALANTTIRGSVWRIFRNRQPASGSAMSPNNMFRFSTTSTSRLSSRSAKSSSAPRQRSDSAWSSRMVRSSAAVRFRSGVSSPRGA